MKARRGLAIFFVVLIAGSAYFERQILHFGGSIGEHAGLIYALCGGSPSRLWWRASCSANRRVTSPSAGVVDSARAPYSWRPRSRWPSASSRMA